MIKAVLFDFGGVLAEEGFKEGLKAIGKRNNLDPDYFYTTCAELVYETGYVEGRSDEHSFWHAVREKTGISADDRELREEILKRFKLRLEMIDYVKKLRSRGLIVALLSDQTNWLDELDKRDPFHHHFDYVFNSFHLGKTKREPSIFTEICGRLRLNPEDVLFIDDNPENVRRASGQGLRAVQFKDARECEMEIQKWIE